MLEGSITRNGNDHMYMYDHISTKRQADVTFGPCGGLGPHCDTTLFNTLTFVESRCTPMVFNVIPAYVVLVSIVVLLTCNPFDIKRFVTRV